MKMRIGTVVAFAFCLIGPAIAEDSVLVLGQPDRPCAEDEHCFNRIHPDIPMVARAAPGQTIVLRTRNALDLDLAERSRGTMKPVLIGAAHPLTGPVHIEGAEPGDAIAVTLHDINPGRFGLTGLAGFGFAYDLTGRDLEVMWRLNRREARSDTLKGVAIPNGSFPGVITTLPDQPLLQNILRRESALARAGGDVYGPEPDGGSPSLVCGANGSAATECLRTIPPREHGGNMDIRYQGVGATIVLPCYLEGCGLAVGDLHFAQGDGEVAGMAIEMDADVTLSVELMKGAGRNMKGPSYSGPSTLLNIPSRRFFATTGFPLKTKGEVPPEMAYLDSPKVADLENLSRDINLAARNALDQMLDHIVATYGYSRAEAHVIASVAVDLRIGQLVDSPNVGVTAVLPVDIFDHAAEDPSR